MKIRRSFDERSVAPQPLRGLPPLTGIDPARRIDPPAARGRLPLRIEPLS